VSKPLTCTHTAPNLDIVRDPTEVVITRAQAGLARLVGNFDPRFATRYDHSSCGSSNPGWVRITTRTFSDLHWSQIQCAPYSRASITLAMGALQKEPLFSVLPRKSKLWLSTNRHRPKNAQGRDEASDHGFQKRAA
jgi:hypothetical protein